jgi:crotonobetainyl-CoA:carnitine CoA-transferase CaiB-like acyl-CoA transferase
MRKPLGDLHFVEFASPGTPQGVRIAIALAGRIAADLGARVSRVQDGADPIATAPPFIQGRSALHAFLNAGKQLVDVREGSALRAGADVCLAPETADPSPSNARVEVRIAMLGAGVPPETPATEFTVLALSGLLNLVGDPDREPLRLAGHQAAYAAGLAAFTGAMGALSALSAQHASGRELVHVSLLDAAVWLNWKNVASASAGEEAPSRGGRAADWPVIRCKDGWVALVYQNADWLRLCALAGNDPRLLDPALMQAAGRAARTEEIACYFEEAWKDLTRAELERMFMAARVPAGPVWSPHELARAGHYGARGVMQGLSLDAEGRIAQFPRLPVRWNGEAFAAGGFPSPMQDRKEAA